MKILNQIQTQKALQEHYPLIEECCRACSDYMHGELHPAVVFAKAWAGDLKAFLIGEAGEGICFCSQEQGILYINAFYLRVEAPREFLRVAGLELAWLAKSLGLQEARFKTQRPAGFKRALGEIGYQPRCVEFAIDVEAVPPPSEEE